MCKQHGRAYALQWVLMTPDMKHDMVQMARGSLYENVYTWYKKESRHVMYPFAFTSLGYTIIPAHVYSWLLKDLDDTTRFTVLQTWLKSSLDWFVRPENEATARKIFAVPAIAKHATFWVPAKRWIPKEPSKFTSTHQDEEMKEAPPFLTAHQ